jgi:hypothetical protein
MKVKKKSMKICMRCSKFINLKKDHYVLIATCNRKTSPDDYSYFHFQCFVDWFNMKVMNKMKAQIQFMQDKAVKLFESSPLAPLLAQVQGSDMAMKMLKLPLGDIKIPKEKVILQIQNDRKKRSGRTKTRKVKM